MNDKRISGLLSDSKRSNSSSRFFAEDIANKPQNLLKNRSQKDPLYSNSKENDNTMGSRRTLDHSDSVNIEKELTGVINRVNRAINKPPISTPKKENRDSQPQILAKVPDKENLFCPYGSTISFSEAHLTEKRLIEGSAMPPLRTNINEDNIQTKLSYKIPMSETKINNGRTTENFKGRSLTPCIQSEAVLLNQRIIEDVKHHSKTQSGSRNSLDIEKKASLSSIGNNFQNEGLDAHAIRGPSSLEGSTKTSLKQANNENNHCITSIHSNKVGYPQKSQDSSAMSILSFPQERFPSKTSPHESQETLLDDTFKDVKVEELCTRLKFVIKRDFSGLQIPLKLLNEAIIENQQAKAITQSVSPQAKSALDRLESAFHKAELIHYQLSSDSSPQDMITQAAISTLKNSSRDLLLTIKAYSNMSCSSMSVCSTPNNPPATPPKHKLHHRPAYQADPDDHFENHSLRLENTKEIRKSSHQIPSSFKKNFMNEFKDDSQTLEYQFRKIDEQNFGFKIHSMARSEKRIFVGFEDGAITEVKMDPMKGVSMVKCYRFKGEPVTEMLVVDSGDYMGSQNLLAAYGLNSPSILVINLNSGKQINELTGHSQFVTRMVKITDNFIATCSFDRSLKVWDLKGGSCHFSQTAHDSPLISCSYSHETSLLASGDLSGNIILWALTFYQGGTIKNFEIYMKFAGSGPILEISFDVHNKIICFEGSKLRVYDSRGTLFKELKCPYFVSSAQFMDPQTLLIMDTAGSPYALDFEQALTDSSLPRPATSDVIGEAELASLMISQRVTGSLPRGQLLRLPHGGKQVFSALGKQLLVHSLINN
jgi:WD40 repeat protein